jgi:hypothetical protein
VAGLLPVLVVTKFDVLDDAVELGISLSGKKSDDADLGVAGGYRRSTRIVIVPWMESEILVRLHTLYDAVNSTMKGTLCGFIRAHNVPTTLRAVMDYVKNRNESR